MLHHQHQLTIIKGPERIEYNWWQKQSSRDYFIATANLEDNNESLATSCEEFYPKRLESFYWIFYDRIKKQWYLHGIYA